MSLGKQPQMNAARCSAVLKSSGAKASTLSPIRNPAFYSQRCCCPNVGFEILEATL